MTERKTLTARDRMLRAIPETDVQKTAQEILTSNGWLWYHAPDNKPSVSTGRVQRITPGFPDIIAIRGTRIIVVELKKETGVVSDSQDQFLSAFQLTGKVETYVIRPSTMDTLRQIAAPEFLR